MTVNVSEELQKYIVKARYARYNRAAGRRETYEEATNRGRAMMLGEFPQVADLINHAYDRVIERRVLGSQRALQFGGEPVLRHHARIYNCCASYVDRLRFFQECLYLLLCGTGVGFSVQREHVRHLPGFATGRRDGSTLPRKTFAVPDSIEGWSDALGELLASYFREPCEVTFDYSLVRPEGSSLSSGAGRAPGPEPLRKAIEKIRGLLDACLARGQTRLRPIDAYDIVMHSSEAVLAGGVRRSATICLFSPDDEEMARAKTGDWFNENPQRARSNNSAMLLRNGTTLEQFSRLMGWVKDWGEPGFIWTDSYEQLLNPCAEIGLWSRLMADDHPGILEEYEGPIYEDGSISGWQFCNLTTINGGLVKTPEDFYGACEAAATIGTLQAAFGKFPYLGRVTEEIVKREALLGVSMTRIMSAPTVMLDPEVLRRGAAVVLETNARVAPLIGVNPCARATCGKPEGTSTLVLGGLDSGCHEYPFARGIRNVQENKGNPILRHFKSVNPEVVEHSVWGANGTDDVVSFPMEAPEGAVIKGTYDAVGFLDVVKLLQENWVTPGKRPELCTQPWLSHNISNTVAVRPDEWPAVERHIYENREYYCGISLLPRSGDKDYRQAPYVSVLTAHEIISEFGCAAEHARGWPTDAFDHPWDAFDALQGTFRGMTGAREDWVKRTLRQLLPRFGGDLARMVLCLKNWYYLRRYESLKYSFRAVDYESFLESDDTTTATQEWACSGGACAL